MLVAFLSCLVLSGAAQASGGVAALTITKGVARQADGPFGASVTTAPGRTVWYAIRVTNTGTVTLTGITLTDSLGLPAGCRVPPKLVRGTWFTCTYPLVAVAGTTTNVATADSDQTDPQSASADVIARGAAPATIRLAMSASPATLPVGGGPVTYTYVVTNPGIARLTAVTVTDDACSPVTFAAGDADGDGMLGPDETWWFSCSAVRDRTATDTAEVRGLAGTLRVSSTATQTVQVASGSATIRLVATANPLLLPAGGGIVTYTYVVLNVGEAPLANVSVTDDHCAGIRLIDGDTDGNGLLDPTEAWVFTCTAAVEQTATSVVLAVAQADGRPYAATDQATVTVVPPTAAPTPSAAPTSSPTPTPTASPSPSETPTPTPSPTPGPTPSPSPTPGPTAAPTDTAAPTATAAPSAASPGAGTAGGGVAAPPGSIPAVPLLLVVLLTGIAAGLVILVLGRSGRMSGPETN